MTHKSLFLSAALLAATQASAAMAAPPTAGSREFDLACAGLTGVAFQGAKTSKAPEDTQFALLNAYGIYVGRLSMRPNPGSVKEVDQIAGALSPEERNTVVNACMAKAKETLGAHLQMAPGAAAPKQ